MLELNDAVRRAATLGAILGAVVGALAGLVFFGDRLFVPVSVMVAGGLAGAALCAGLALRRTRMSTTRAPETAADAAG
jgi:hypothetical protein